MSEFKTLSDKDKIIAIVNICTANLSRQRGCEILSQAYQHFSQMFDDSVKVVVMPVLDKSLQKIEVFNAEKCDEEILRKFNENYEKVIESFSK